ncbi:hypothetical protein Bca52824_044409 [Brassica carinata]|uniref:AAA+ ATPase At3g28540-like C-terminal domain-containing protein n=1 Tax=Brassica carinata TaxID=52824 RepID=A0A8X7S0J8_BRACI|nr:hypothetical protein Bca52824_044409 [Brassica carinata]
MANHLKFDVFDVELSSVYDNRELKRVLLSTTNRSILVIEDIDCNAEVRDRGEDESGEDEKDRGKVTLSVILNLIDWVMDGYAYSYVLYCTGLGFRTLVSNYLGLDGSNHPLCEEIERLIDSTEVTPAELAEELMQDDDADAVLRGVMSFVEKRKVERSKAKEEISICKDVVTKTNDDDKKQSGSANG